MFDFVCGRLIKKTVPHLVVEVGGIGYRLEAPLSVCERLTEGEEVQLFTHLLIRNDSMVIFAFSSPEEREVFDRLTSVSGIGPKLGLSILSTFNIDEVATLLKQQDLDRLKLVPGLGPKTARRLLAELGEEDLIDRPSAEKDDRSFRAVDALIFLGYKKVEATNIIQQINDPSLSTEQLVRAALQQLQQKITKG